jgi:hypothetical protein
MYRLGDVRHVFASTSTARDRHGLIARMTFGNGMIEFATARLRDAIPR